MLDEPFEFVRGPEAEAAAGNPNLHGVKLGGGFMIEKYPDTFPWKSPANPERHAQGFRHGDPVWGVCTCGSCGYRAKHQLQWPEDAFYATEIRGQLLWAWNRTQVVALRAYIASTDRTYTGIARDHFWFLRYVPKHFLEVKHRAEALKKLDRLLEKR
jgi:hypothetical protein